MKTLSKKEIKQISGGGLMSRLRFAVFAAGYIASDTLDGVHGLFDGLMGIKEH